MIIEDWAFSREEAGAITGFTENQILKMQLDYDLFDGKSQGRGSSMSYHLSDLLKLAAIRFLKDAGIRTRAAVEAIEPFSLYGIMLQKGILPGEKGPGIFPLTMVEGRLTAVHDLRAPTSQVIKIDTWALYDRIVPLMVEIMKADPSRAENLDARIRDSLLRFAEIRNLHRA